MKKFVFFSIFIWLFCGCVANHTKEVTPTTKEGTNVLKSLTRQKQILVIPDNLNYFGEVFEKYTSFVSDKTILFTFVYLPKTKKEYGQLDIYYSPVYKKQDDFNDFLHSTIQENAKFEEKNQAKVYRLSNTTALQTMLWYPNQRWKNEDDKNYEINFSLIEYKDGCGLVQVIHRQQFIDDGTKDTENKVKEVFFKSKEYFLKNHPNTSCQ